MFKESKVIRLDKIDGKYRFGSGNWTDDIMVYVNNFRDEDGVIVATLDVKTNESYVNRQGKVCYWHRNCGTIRLTREECTIDIDVGGEEKLTCRPVYNIENGREYVTLVFNPAM